MALQFTAPSDVVTIGGNQITLTALPCGTTRRLLMPLVNECAAGNIFEGETYDKVLAVCAMSMAATEPSVTPEMLENSILLGDLPELFMAVVRVSGLTRKGAQPGEAQRQKIPSASGATSTGISQQPQDGPMPILTPS